ncbi:MAG TPA: hypothetical protein VK969_04680, partial [Acidimicrobiia bacterium]|nr:hypothetical protein [Acidimicrobiia bacterium]
GFAMGTLVTTDVNPRSEVPTTETSVVDEPAAPESAGVSAVIPGFPDALVAVGGGVGAGVEVWHWPSEGPLVTRGMTDGEDVRFDATGQFVAVTEPIPGLQGFLLSMGRFNSIRAVRAEVTSFAWHDSRSGEVAYTTESEGRWQLYRAARTLVPQIVLDGRFETGSVVAWGEWGYAIQIEDDQVALVNGEGEFKAFGAGKAYSSHESGWVFMTDDDLKVVSAGGGVRRFMPLPDELNPVSAASFSPDASMVAMAARSGVVVLDRDTEELIELSPSFPADWVTWSSDSRFVLAPAQSGVYVHDLESGETHHVLTGRSVAAAAVFPAGVS